MIDTNEPIEMGATLKPWEQAEQDLNGISTAASIALKPWEQAKQEIRPDYGITHGAGMTTEQRDLIRRSFAENDPLLTIQDEKKRRYIENLCMGDVDGGEARKKKIALANYYSMHHPEVAGFIYENIEGAIKRYEGKEMSVDQAYASVAEMFQPQDYSMNRYEAAAKAGSVGTAKSAVNAITFLSKNLAGFLVGWFEKGFDLKYGDDLEADEKIFSAEGARQVIDEYWTPYKKALADTENFYSEQMRLPEGGWVLNSNGFADFVENGTVALVNYLPQLAGQLAMTMGTGSVAPLAFVYGVDGYYDIKEDEELGDVSEGKALLYGLGIGLINGALEKITLDVATGNVTEKFAKEGLKKGFLNAFKYLAITTGKEGAEEGIEEFAENLLDIGFGRRGDTEDWTAGRWMKELFQGVPEAGLLGAVTGFGMGTMPMGAMKQLAVENERARQTIESRIGDLEAKDNLTPEEEADLYWLKLLGDADPEDVRKAAFMLMHQELTMPRTQTAATNEKAGLQDGVQKGAVPQTGVENGGLQEQSQDVGTEGVQVNEAAEEGEAEASARAERELKLRRELPHNPADTAAEIEKWKKLFPNANIQTTDAWTPEQIRILRQRGVLAPEKAQGMFDIKTNTVILNVSNLRPSEVGFKVLHEVGLHYGIRQAFGDEAANRLFLSVFDAMQDSPFMQRIIDAYKLRTPMLDENGEAIYNPDGTPVFDDMTDAQKAEAAEEFLAFAAETYGVPIDEIYADNRAEIDKWGREHGRDTHDWNEKRRMTREWMAETGFKPERPGWWKQLISQIRVWLAEHGFGHLREADIETIIQDAFKGASRTNRANRANGESRFALGGELGASRLNNQNYNIAIEMEEAGKDKKTIWRATGWERGKDGKWRFELPDAKVKMNVLKSEELQDSNGWYLYDFIEAKELFEAYPDLKDIIVRIEDMPPLVNGHFDSSAGEIVLNRNGLIDTSMTVLKWREDDAAAASNDAELAEANAQLSSIRKDLADVINDTLVHEVQHAIQEIEGFAKGTNPEEAGRMTDEERRNVDMAFVHRNGYQELLEKGIQRIGDILQEAGVESGTAQKMAQLFKDFLESDNGKTWSDHDVKQFIENMIQNSLVTKPDEKTVERLLNGAEKLRGVRDNINKYDENLTPLKTYMRFAGETESRNVQGRRDMSDEERRQTPPSATEDVSRQYQIVRFSVAEDSFGDSEKDLMGTIPVRPENTFKSVHDVLSGLRDKSFVNLETSQEAKLSLTGINKMLSAAARMKSKDNGFTDAEHFQASANIDYLYINGTLIEERGDRDEDPNIKSIKRFVSPFYTGREFAEAIITVKESVEHGNRIYSVELDEIKKPSNPYVGGLELNPATPPANDGNNKIQQKIEKANEFLKKIEKNQDNSRFSVSPVYTGSAADYDQPSLFYVGTGEGNQVYGWGLYGSSDIGVAETYAEADAKDKASADVLWDGKPSDFFFREMRGNKNNYRNQTDDYWHLTALNDILKDNQGDIDRAKKSVQKSLDLAEEYNRPKDELDGLRRRLQLLEEYRDRIKYRPAANISLTINGDKIVYGQAYPKKADWEKVMFNFLFSAEGDRQKALRNIDESIQITKARMPEDEKLAPDYQEDLSNFEKAKKFLSDKKNQIVYNDRVGGRRNIYNQTFWPGKKENLLDWDESIPDDQANQILDALAEDHDNSRLIDYVNAERGVDAAIDGEEFEKEFYYPPDVMRDYLEKYLDFYDANGERVYKQLSDLFGSPKAASEFLYRAGFDGVTYIGDSSGVRNYVAFSDKDIRVDEHIRFSVGGVDENLIVVHNVSEQKLRDAIKLGALPVPSIGIIDAEKSDFTDYGRITLVGDRDLIDPKRPKNKIFNSDIYSARRPEIQRLYSDEDYDRALKVIKPYEKDAPFRESIDRLVQYHKDGMMSSDFEDDLKQLDAVKNWYASTREGDEKFEDWWIRVATPALDLHPRERIFDGYTNSGRRRYLPANLETIVKLMTRKVKDSEGFFFGVGNIRANLAKQFKSVADIQKNRDKIIPGDEYKALKKEVQDEYYALLDDIEHAIVGSRVARSREAAEDILRAMAEGPNKKQNREWLDMALGRDNEIYQEMGDFLMKLKNLPTPLFEAKPQRAVYLDEFRAAVVPAETSNDILTALEKAGVRVYTYTDDAERKATLQKATQDQNLRFSLGDIDGNEAARSYIDIIKPYVPFDVHDKDGAYYAQILKEKAGLDIEPEDAMQIAQEAWHERRKASVKKSWDQAYTYFEQSNPLFQFLVEFAGPDFKVRPAHRFEGEKFTGSFIAPEYVKYSEKREQGERETDWSYNRYNEKRERALKSAKGLHSDEAAAASGADTSLSAAGASLDPASDSLFGKSGVGLLASL